MTSRLRCGGANLVELSVQPPAWGVGLAASAPGSLPQAPTPTRRHLSGQLAQAPEDREQEKALPQKAKRKYELGRPAANTKNGPVAYTQSVGGEATRSTGP